MHADPGLAGQHVLLVDAGDFTAGYVGAALAGLGAVVTAMRTAADVVEALGSRSVRPDVAVLDMEAGRFAVLIAAEALAAAGIPFLTIASARAEIPMLLSGHPHLRQPFAGFQVAESVVALIGARTTPRG